MNELLYGVHAVMGCLSAHPTHIKKITCLKSADQSRIKPMVSLARQHQIPVEVVDKQVFRRLCPESIRHQGIVADFKPLVLASENECLAQLETQRQPLVLILDAIQDPHNFGACLRCAAAVGVDAVIFPKDKSAQLTPAVHHVSAGTSFTLPLYQITNLARVMRGLQQLGIWIYGADASAEEDLYQHDFRGGCAVVMGAEGEGMRALTKKHCDYLFKIPMSEGVESLNVSVATGISLFEVKRQRMMLSTQSS